MRSTLESEGSVVHRAVWFTFSWLFIATTLFPAGLISTARADLLEYTYTGTPYTLFNTQPGEVGYPYYVNSPGPDSPYSGANSISGDVIIDTGTSGITAATYGIVDFLSVSDGVTMYSGPPQPGDITQVFGSLTIDNSGTVTDGELTVYRPASNGGFTRLFVNPSAITVPISASGAAPYYAGADAFTSADYEALSETPGTWSGPIDLSTGGGTSGGSGGGSPTSSACTADLQNTVLPSLPTSVVSSSGQPVEITATFLPNNLSLASAEADCGVQQFDWQQTVLVSPPPGNLAAPSNPSVPLTSPIPSTFLDPPAGGYIILPSETPQLLPCTVVQNPANPRQYTASNFSIANASANPFLYAPNGPNGDCASLQDHETPSSLSFFDLPADPSLTPGEELGFQTCLVGVDSAGNPVYLPASDNICFLWTDTFTGYAASCDPPTPSPGGSQDCTIFSTGTGGTSITYYDDYVPTDFPGLDLGTGGIEIISNAAAVPEPSALLLLVSGCGLLIILSMTRVGHIR